MMVMISEGWDTSEVLPVFLLFSVMLANDHRFLHIVLVHN